MLIRGRVVITAMAALALATMISPRPEIDLALLVRGIAWSVATFVGAKFGASLKNDWRAPTTRTSANTSTLRIFVRGAIDCLIFVLYFANMALWYGALSGCGRTVKTQRMRAYFSRFSCSSRARVAF